ncbi:MAG: hypothetical protein SOW32_04670 [Agathobacter sp.]|nr:hypothetical protein [Agathobacter sp.]
MAIIGIIIFIVACLFISRANDSARGPFDFSSSLLATFYKIIIIGIIAVILISAAITFWPITLVIAIFCLTYKKK